MNEGKAQKGGKKSITELLSFHCFLLPERKTETKEDKQRLNIKTYFFPQHMSVAIHLLTVAWFRGYSLLQINYLLWRGKKKNSKIELINAVQKLSTN